MKTKLVVILVAALVVGGVAFYGDYESKRRVGDPASFSDSGGFGFASFIVTGAGVAFVLIGLPWLWKGAMKCTRDLSKSIRDKD